MNDSPERHSSEHPVTALPELSAETITRIEGDVFAEIQKDRTTQRASRARRSRAWIGTGAAAGVLLVAALIAPAVLNSIQGASMGDSIQGASMGGSVDVSPHTGPAVGLVRPDLSGEVQDSLREVSGESLGISGTIDAPSSRDIIANGSASLTVDDVEKAARAIGDAAVAAGGYVDSMDLGSSGGIGFAERNPDSMGSPGLPTTQSYGWISVRVPADELSSAMDALAQVGSVTASSVSRQDVTAQSVDLRARISAAEASVARLTELMAQSGSLGDLIAAESALAERQAALESDRQQLKMLDEQVSMSGLTVQLTVARESVAANPAGFGDGLATGWNSLVATLNGVVVALGFLAPWLVVIAIVGVIVWAITRSVRRSRAGRPTAD